jgi:predicted transcriptional regulator
MKQTKLSIIVTEDQKKKLTQVAKEQERSISYIIRKLIDKMEGKWKTLYLK